MPVLGKHKNVLAWTDDLDEKTIAQAERCAALPFTAGHVALMPDTHFGYGATVGSVIPTKGAVVPYAVGVDIGCGMIAVQTSVKSDALGDDLSPLHDHLVKAIPAGMGKGHNSFDFRIAHDKMPHNTIALDASGLEKAWKQFGSLGGGNHFVEVCLDERDFVWLVLHSGSRGIGKQIADVHITQAKDLMKHYFIELEDPNLAYLVEGTPEFDAYIKAMLWAQDYAAGNRDAMMDAALHEFKKFVGLEQSRGQNWKRINCHHNFTEMENHSGRNMWITRKGAIRAREGDLGIIPGSMGTSSYIVSGLGNKASYCSCSHGAGRRLGRKQADRELNIDDFKASMAGVTWDESKADQLLDESPQAYKDIDQVMHNQRDLARIEHKLHQVLNMKGTK